MKRILALALTIVMLFSLASCNLFQNTDPQETTNEGTTPEVTTPEVTTPEVTTPADTRVTYTVTVVDENNTPLTGATVQLCVGDICRLPSVTNAEGVATFQFDKDDYTVKVSLAGYTGETSYSFAAGSTELKVQLTKIPDGTTPGGSAPNESTPNESTPKEDDPTVPEIDVSLPEASQVIATIIGAVAASVEVSENSQFIYIIEQENMVDGSTNSTKQVLFFEVAEAAVDSNGEVLKAHLKIKVGEAVVELPGYGSSQDVVVEKDDITSYYIFNVVVDGEDVSVTVNDENASANLSELVYGAIAQMMGLESVEELENLLTTAAIAQELEKNLMPIIANAIGGALEEMPTVSPEYIEHLETLFGALGEDIMTETTDEATGNTTYSLNIEAFKNLLADIEGKTLTEYLEGVYGENVVGELSSFLKSLPDKKVREIVDAAVALAEESGIEIKDIYALIDMYVYSAAGVEFSIEEQINTRYNNTLADLLAEFYGFDPVALKDSFTNAAEMLETVSVDELLSSMFMGANEGFIEALKETIDMFDEQIVYTLTVDADGYVVALNYGIGDLQYSLVVEGEDSILTVSMPNGAEFVVTINSEGFTVVVTQDGELAATGSVTATEEIIGEETITTVVVDLRDDENDLVDYTAVYVDGVLTTLDAVIRGYDVWYEGYYDEVTGEKFEVRHEEFVEILAVEYDDLGEAGQVLNLYSSGNTIQIAQMGDDLTLVVTDGDEVIASGSVSITDEIIDEDTVTTLVIDLCDSENDLLDYTVVSVNGAITKIDIVVRGEDVWYDCYYDEETGEFIEVEYREFGELFQAGLEIIDNEEGEDYVRIECQGLASVLGYEFTENSMKIAMYDENMEEILAMLEVVDSTAGEKSIHVIWGGAEFKLIGEEIEGGVKFTLSDEVAQSNIVVLEFTVNDEDALVIDIDLDQIQINAAIGEIYYEEYYIAFDGAIVIKLA